MDLEVLTAWWQIGCCLSFLCVGWVGISATMLSSYLSQEEERYANLDE